MICRPDEGQERPSVAYVIGEANQELLLQNELRSLGSSCVSGLLADPIDVNISIKTLDLGTRIAG